MLKAAYKKKLLFSGELPPKSVTGLSISNEINLRMLSDFFEIYFDEERFFIGDENKPLNKTVFFVKRVARFAHLLVKNKFDYYYLNVSLSRIGIVKTFVFLVLFKALSRGHIISHIHRGDVLYFLNSGWNNFFFKRILRASSISIVLSENLAKSIRQRFNLPDNRVQVLENTIENEYELDAPKRSSNDKFIFVYLSNYIEEKGVLDLLTVFRDFQKGHSNCLLKCFGQFFNEEIERRVKSFACDNIIIHGKIEGIEKFRELFSSDCFILPSKNEGKPVVLLEAMYCGLPIIASDVGFIKEMLPPNYSHLYKSGDTHQLTGHMKKMLEISNVGQKLRNHYNKHFSHQQHRQSLLRLFNIH